MFLHLGKNEEEDARVTTRPTHTHRAPPRRQCARSEGGGVWRLEVCSLPHFHFRPNLLFLPPFFPSPPPPSRLSDAGRPSCTLRARHAIQGGRGRAREGGANKGALSRWADAGGLTDVIKRPDEAPVKG